MQDRGVFADRVHRFAAPTWVVFDALTSDVAKWLPLQPGEVQPQIVAAVRPERVVWSSLWPVSPGDTVEFELSRLGGGTALRFRWLTDSPPDERGVGITRRRLNTKLASDLRGWVDSPGSPVSWDPPERS